MNDREYNEIEAIRRSDLWLMNKSPMHFKWRQEEPTERSEALIFGSATHKYILEKGTFFEEYAIKPEDINLRTNAGKVAMAEFEAKNKGKDIITIDQFKQIVLMDYTLKENNGFIKDIIARGEKERAFVWSDLETGERCKVKTDLLVRIADTLFIFDYKTTTSCADGDFERSARKYGYQFQAGMYSEGVEQELLEKTRFGFIAQEKTEPYAYRIYWADTAWVDRGRKQFHDLLRRYHRCKEANEWPGYETTELLDESYE